MAVASREYQKVPRKQFAKSVIKVTPENRYWQTFISRFEDTLHTSVPFVRFCVSEPYQAVTCSHLDVRIFRSSTMQCCKKSGVLKHNPPLCGDIRNDGKVVAIGGTRGNFKVFNNGIPANLRIMRSLRGHPGDIRDVRWQLIDSLKILSAGDDSLCGYWDMVAEKRVLSIKAHSDFVRSVDWMFSEPTCFVSGSYDHTVKLWDSRDCKGTDDFTADGKISPGHKAQFQHGFPVEAVLAIPYSDLVAVAGGTSVKVWSLRKSKEPLFEVNIHNKSVTSMTTNSSGSRLLTGSIDRFIRVFRFQQGGS